MNAKELVKGTASMLVLQTLRGEALHGYALIRKLRANSEGLFDMKEGTLYPILHALEEQGLVEASWEGEGRRKRVYSITRHGEHKLDLLQAEWQRAKRAVDLVMGGAVYGTV